MPTRPSSHPGPPLLSSREAPSVHLRREGPQLAGMDVRSFVDRCSAFVFDYLSLAPWYAALWSFGARPPALAQDKGLRLAAQHQQRHGHGHTPVEHRFLVDADVQHIALARGIGPADDRPDVAAEVAEVEVRLVEGVEFAEELARHGGQERLL